MSAPGLLSRLAERIDHSTLRERVLVFAVGLVILCTAWQTLLMDRLGLHERSAHEALAGLEHNSANLAASVPALDPDTNPTLRALQREQALRSALSAAERDLGQASQGFVDPARMPEVVRAVLSQQSGLVLVSLKSLPVETVLPVAAGAEPRGPYVHPLEIVVDGSYPQIVAYLHSLESLPWRLSWRRVELETRDYPLNRARIEIATLSLSREWLRV
jgi:MSHA biogenesis protein MshJ